MSLRSRNSVNGEFYARDIRIIESREEITFLFGAASRDPGEGGGLLIDSVSRIILTPTAAKRLSLALNDILARSESTRSAAGPFSGDVRRRHLSYDHKASYTSAKQAAGADRLVGFVDALGVPYGLEHSFKLFNGAILGDRVLLGFHRKELGDAAAGIMPLCSDLGMPDRFQRIFREHLNEANILLFGYEGDRENGTYKAYLEFGDMFMTLASESSEKPDPFLLHLGFKWDAADNRKAALARYTCHFYLSEEDMLARVRERFYPDRQTKTFEVVKGIVEKAATRMRSDEFLYLEVAEENNPRSSYDINMYRANLTLEDLYPLLRDACRSWRIPPESFHRLYDPMKKRIFGHVSGGSDREGRDFLTFYYGVAGSSR